MLSTIKEVIKKTYTRAVTENTGCGCGPSCCSTVQDTTFLKEGYADIPGYESVADYGLGCGLPTEIAGIKEGDFVLDLGSGAGNDVFIAAKLTGQTGRVIGVDFTPAMIQKANENKRKLGLEQVSFMEGDIEQLPIEDNSMDVVISNCVLNLVPDKPKAFSEVFRVLKPGGHFSISDVVTQGELPVKIRNAAEMVAGCIGGAPDKNVYLDLLAKAGFEDIQIHKQHEISLPDEQLSAFLSQEELEAFRMSKSAILSITVNGFKPKNSPL